MNPKLLDAAILAVGSEMLTPARIDTNSLYLTAELNALGIEVREKRVIGDDRERLTAAVRDTLLSCGVLIVTGGLGPTEDDVTREAVAAALGRGLHYNDGIAQDIAARFARMKRVMAEINKRQAMVIDGADVLPNDRGSAPGLWIAAGESVIMLLPGPPRELTAMFEGQCKPRLAGMLPPQVITALHLRVAGMTESDLDQLIAPVYTRYTNPVTTVLASLGDIEVHLRARTATSEEGEALLQEVCGQLEPLLGSRLYTRRGELLEELIVRLLRERNETVCVAESCTGGLLGERITSVPGSSHAFAGGFLTYTNRLKTELLRIPAGSLENGREVSEDVAIAMAKAARERLATTYALSVTGYAGPDGGTEETPVGAVFIGLATPDSAEARRVQFIGDRARIRALAAQSALDLLRRRLQYH